ncbi:hypothetical protein PVK06_021934 [Gossypium arboreum]|uniref:Gnk2-homologous domain-containing protein n=1 Tax=Gossypium arboreum TaxID=29729 RepID=A0ABR0PRB8_GOSAR|nr:hypothetical protein PVK06_021934 [Gossypium arboreum]
MVMKFFITPCIHQNHHPYLKTMYLNNPVFAFVLVIILVISLTNAQTCLETGNNFTTNSLFARNRNLLLTSLPTNVSKNGGFFNTSIGEGLNRVYAQALCRGDLSGEDCFVYVNFTAHQLLSSCKNQTEAFSWDGDIPCLVRYSDKSLSGVLALEPIQEGINPNAITDVASNLTLFFELWGELMEAVAKKASMGSSKLKYATGMAEEIQALMQCTPDLSESNCLTCLRTLIRRYTACCRTYQGGYVETPSCRMRWDLYMFFSPTADTVRLSLSSPPPDSIDNPLATIKDNKESISSKTITIIVVPVIVFVAIVAAGFVLRRKTKSSKQDMNNKDNGLELESLQFQLKSMSFSTTRINLQNIVVFDIYRKFAGLEKLERRNEFKSGR